MSIVVLVDLENVGSLVSKPELFVDLVNFAKYRGNLILFNIYYNFVCSVKAKTRFESLGCKCIDVGCNSKNGADNQIIAHIVEVIDKHPDVKEIIVVSGDKDFKYIVRLAKKQDKKVVILGQRGNVKTKMRKIANEFYYLDQLPELVKNSSPNAITQQPCHITFEQATQLFIQAIHAVQRKGKPAIQQRLATWIFKHPNFPLGSKVSSIYKQDGSPFYNFSSFVEAVLKTGKVQKINDEFFVVESLKQAA